MRKLITIFAFLIYSITNAQEYANNKTVIAALSLAENKYEKYLDWLLKTEYYSEYTNTKSEFEINRLRQKCEAEFIKARQNIDFSKTYILSINYDKFEYTFSNNSFKVDVSSLKDRFSYVISDYLEGFSVKNYHLKSPSLFIQNQNCIRYPLYFSVPIDIAEKSINMRNAKESNKRGKITIRYYFKFLLKEEKSIDKYHNRYNEHENVYLQKMELFDKYTGFTSVVECEIKNFTKTQTNNPENNNQNNNNINSNASINSSIENIEKDYSDQFINYLKLDEVSKSIAKLEEFNGKYKSTNCEKGYFEFLNYDYENSTIKTSRRNCINILGNENYEYKFYKNYLIYYLDLGKFKNGQSKFILNILFIDNLNQLVVKEFHSNDQGSADFNNYIYKK